MELLPIFATFLGLAALMTYLTRAYQWAKAEIDVGSYEPFVAEPAE